MLNDYEPVANTTSSGSGAAISSGGSNPGGASADGGGGTSTGGSAPACEPSDCTTKAQACQTCNCGADQVCTCVPAPEATPCDDGGQLCSATGLCVACLVDQDCRNAGESCDSGVCVPPSCDDGILSPTETGVDCGGPDCAACPNGDGCLQANDCLSQYCAGSTCSPCSSQSQCSTNRYCDVVDGTCDPKKSILSPCGNDYECVSDNCVSGLCGN